MTLVAFGNRAIFKHMIASVLLGALGFFFAIKASAVEADSVDAQLLNQVVEALGGEERLRQLEQLQVSSQGQTYASHMGLLPEHVKQTGYYQRENFFNVSAKAFHSKVQRQFTYEPGHGFPEQTYELTTVNERGQVTGGANPLGLPGGPLPSALVAAIERMNYLVNPQFLLREVLLGDRTIVGQSESMSDAGEGTTLTISDPISPISLTINPQTNEIEGLETWGNSLLLRDVKVAVKYKEWRSKQGFSFPGEIEISIGGKLLRREYQKNATLNPELASELFALDDAVSEKPINGEAVNFGRSTLHIHEEFFEIAGLYYAESADYKVTELAPGLYQVQDVTSSFLSGLAVQVDEGIVLLEGHSSPRAADQLIERVEELFPNKPISYLVQSHHHVDHSAGVRSIAAKGAELVVGNGSGNWWKRVLSARSTLKPDTLQGTDISPTIHELSPKAQWVVSDINTTVTAYHVSDNSHALDMLITTIETDKQTFLYVADLYNAGYGFTMSFDGPQALFRAMRKFGIIDENCRSKNALTFVPTHGTPTQLQAGLDELRSLNIDVGCSLN